MKTAELIGSTLNWAVQQCEGTRKDIDFVWWHDHYSPSTDWAQGGPIIERERISVWARGNEWASESFIPNQQGHEQTGPTPLIAAMRCYVASKLGDEVEIPEGLL